ncbi:MAG: hypothetical protein HZB16_20485 [Armatimonadetes bacterium]|nr:hypothetical protein [Armatimonadota bacterium]
MSATAEIIEGLAKLTPPQLAALAVVVKAMAELASVMPEDERPPTPRELMGSCAPLTRSLTMEDFRACRDEMTAEVEAKWAAREDWL